MPKVINKMDNNSDEQFIIMQDVIEYKRQDIKANKKGYDDKMTKVAEESKSMLESAVTAMMDQISMLKPFPYQKYSPNPPDPTTLVPANSRSPPLDSQHSTKLVACGL